MRSILRSLDGRLLVLAAGAGFVALVAALGIAMSRDVGADPLGEVDPGIERVAEFSLPRLDGGEVAIADHSGGPVFLYFWASWCAPCEREAPLIQRLWPEYEARGYTFLGINIIDNEAGARDFVERHGLTFPTLVDRDGGVYFDFGVNGVPEAFFLAPGLRVERKFLGELREDEFREMLDGLEAAARGGAS